MIFNLIMFFSLCLGMFYLYHVIDSIVNIFYDGFTEERVVEFAFHAGLGWIILMNTATIMAYLFWLVKGGMVTCDYLKE